MSALPIGQNQQMDAFFKSIAPLVEQPYNRYPETAKIPDVNHFGWIDKLSELIGLEKSLEVMDPQTHRKVQSAFDRVIGSMVALGFDVNKQLVWQAQKATHLCAYVGCPMLLRALIRNGADPNGLTHNTYGTTPLHEAAFHDKFTAAIALIEEGADVNYPCKDFYDGVLPLHAATSPEMIRLLVEKGCPVNSVSNNIHQTTALHWNAHCLELPAIQTLLELGATDFDHPVHGGALNVARDIHHYRIGPMMGRDWNTETSQKIIELLSMKLPSFQDGESYEARSNLN